jgi:hypothetical protein
MTTPIPFADWHGDTVSLRPGHKMNAVTALPYKVWYHLPDETRRALFLAIPRGRKAMRRVMFRAGLRTRFYKRRTL